MGTEIPLAVIWLAIVWGGAGPLGFSPGYAYVQSQGASCQRTSFVAAKCKIKLHLTFWLVSKQKPNTKNKTYIQKKLSEPITNKIALTVSQC